MYYFSNGQLKAANKMYSNIANDYEIALDNYSVIEICRDAAVVEKMPKLVINPVPIAQIANMTANAFVGEY